MRISLFVIVVVLASPAAWPTAGAAVDPDASAAEVADAISALPGLVTGASWTIRPSSGTPSAVVTTPLLGFPRDGSSYAVLSTGESSRLTEPRATVLSDGNGGFFKRGNGDLDAIDLHVDLAVPSDASCLSLDFRFLSEEGNRRSVFAHPSDPFVVQLDQFGWSSDSIGGITAPGGFAEDERESPVRPNAIGLAALGPAASIGTAYDFGTTVLRASTPITPGAHYIQVMISDEVDANYDSAVLIDNLTVDDRDDCAPGLRAVVPVPTAVAVSPPYLREGRDLVLNATSSSGATDGEWWVYGSGNTLTRMPGLVQTLSTADGASRCGHVVVWNEAGEPAGASTCTTVYDGRPIPQATLDQYGPQSGENVTFDGTSSYDHDGNVTAWRWDLDGTTVATTSTFTRSFTGFFCVRLFVTDDDGLESLNWYAICSAASKLLRVTVTPDKEEYGVLDTPKLDVLVQTARGTPFAGATVTLEGDYHTRTELDLAPAFARCGAWTDTGVTDATGHIVFTAPSGIANRCLLGLGPSIAEIPTEPRGDYGYVATAVKGVNEGSASGGYEVELALGGGVG